MIRINPHWKAFKAEAIRQLGYENAAEFMRFAAHSVRNIGPDGCAEHFEFAAKQIEMEGKRDAAA
jgi:hypothetical protein